MNVEGLIGSNNVSVVVVNGLRVDQRVGVLVGQAGVMRKRDKDFPIFNVDLAGKVRSWITNSASLEALSKVYGFETNDWLAKRVVFGVEKTKTNVEMVVGRPL